MPGEPLYTIVDLSQVWLIAEVFEQDLADVAVGQKVAIDVNAYPGRPFTGRVAFIYPKSAAKLGQRACASRSPTPASS